VPLWCKPASDLRCSGAISCGVFIQVGSARCIGTNDAHQGNSCHTGALRLSACARDAEKGWLARQSQTHLPAVSCGRLVLASHKRPKRNKSAKLRQPKNLTTTINEIWSMDFVSDALYDGWRLRALTIVDNFTRESLAINVGQSLKGEDVVDTLLRLKASRGLPKIVKVDNGPEFISKALDRLAYENGIEIDFSRPGKPTDNAKVESFNGRFREECLNAHWFMSLDDAKRKIEAWRKYYNEARPHSALDWATPAEFAHGCGLEPASMASKEPEISTTDRY